MAPVSLNFPPLDHSHLFPDLVNFHMERNPSVPFFVYTNESVPNSLTEISFLEFGRAAHRVAHALRPSRQGPDGEVVMVIANTDTIHYHAIVAGLSVAGWVVRSCPSLSVLCSHSNLAIPGVAPELRCCGCQYDAKDQLLAYRDP